MVLPALSRLLHRCLVVAVGLLLPLLLLLLQPPEMLSLPLLLVASELRTLGEQQLLPTRLQQRQLLPPPGQEPPTSPTPRAAAALVGRRSITIITIRANPRIKPQQQRLEEVHGMLSMPLQEVEALGAPSMRQLVLEAGLLLHPVVDSMPFQHLRLEVPMDSAPSLRRPKLLPLRDSEPFQLPLRRAQAGMHLRSMHQWRMGLLHRLHQLHSQRKIGGLESPPGRRRIQLTSPREPRKRLREPPTARPRRWFSSAPTPPSHRTLTSFTTLSFATSLVPRVYRLTGFECSPSALVPDVTSFTTTLRQQQVRKRRVEEPQP